MDRPAKATEFIRKYLCYIYRKADRNQLDNSETFDRRISATNTRLLWQNINYVSSFLTYNGISRGANRSVVKMPHSGPKRAEWQDQFGRYGPSATVDVQKSTHEFINLQFQMGVKPHRYTYSCVLVPKDETTGIPDEDLRTAFRMSAAIRRKVKLVQITEKDVPVWRIEIIPL